MAHAAFLQAILDAPDDDTPRLVYADWLDEHGDPDRAECIRVQCALARPERNDRHREFERREMELLARHQEEWAAPFRALVDGWTFQRGFVARVRMSGERFTAAPETLLRLAPVQHVDLYWGATLPPVRAQRVARLCACPDLTRLRRLDLTHNYLGSAGMQALAACEYLGGLTHLDLNHNHVGDGGMRALASSPLLTNLRFLDLSANDVGPAGVRSLLAGVRVLEEAGRPLRLEQLDLRGNRLGFTGRREIHAAPLVRRIALL